MVLDWMSNRRRSGSSSGLPSNALKQTGHQWRAIQQDENGAPKEVLDALNNWPDDEVDFYLFSEGEQIPKWIVFRLFDENEKEVMRYAAPILFAKNVKEKP